MRWADPLRVDGAEVSLAEVLDGLMCLIPLRVAVLDRGGRFIYLNRAAAEGLGLDRSEIVGRRLRDLQRRSADLTEHLEGMFESVFETGRQCRATLSIPGPTGVRDFEVEVTPWFEAAGEVRLALCASREIPRRDAPPGARPRLPQNGASTSAPLTERQNEVLRLLVRGLSGKEIAETLKISVRTVESHRQQIHARLGTTSRAQLFRYATANGFFNLED